MEHFPFTSEEAVDICEDFEDLADTDYNLMKPQAYIIHNVVTCPYNEDNRKLFIENYHRTKDQQEAIYFYKGNEFDVLVFAYDADDDTRYTVVDIRTYTETLGIRYHFPGTARPDHG